MFEPAALGFKHWGMQPAAGKPWPHSGQGFHLRLRRIFPGEAGETMNWMGFQHLGALRGHQMAWLPSSAWTVMSKEPLACRPVTLTV